MFNSTVCLMKLAKASIATPLPAGQRSAPMAMMKLGLATVGIACMLSGPVAGETASERFDTQPRPLSLIQPGTAIDDRAPAPWTHLIIKSLPNVEQGDLRKMSSYDRKLSSLVHTVTLARVQRDSRTGAYVLGDVGIGLCTPVNGVDTVVSPDTQKQLGANLGMLAKLVLSNIYSEQQKVHYVARSATTAIYDTPAVVRWKAENRPMILRYTIIVDSASGRLDTFVWMIDQDSNGRYLGTESPAHLLENDKILQCALHVDANEYTFNIPSKNAFAICKMPQGEHQFQIPPQLAVVAAKKVLSEDEANTLANSLRQAATSTASRSGQRR
ncbi:MAG: hypothetical protein R3E01_30255 [Pirellulaceae bacterium]|nr:hypothetical protein [Planctomycetales bacterium]